MRDESDVEEDVVAPRVPLGSIVLALCPTFDPVAVPAALVDEPHNDRGYEGKNRPGERGGGHAPTMLAGAAIGRKADCECPAAAVTPTAPFAQDPRRQDLERLDASGRHLGR